MCSWRRRAARRRLSNDSGPNNVYVGGFRPQTVAAQGFVAGPTAVQFDVARMQSDNAVALVVLALTPGDLLLTPFGDPRNVGVAVDPLLTASLGASSAFRTPLSGGAGSTPSLPITLPAGVSLVYATFGVTVTGGFGDLTDVRTITL